MSNNNEEAAIKRISTAVARVFRDFGLSEDRRTHSAEADYFAVALFVAVLVGSYSILGGFQMAIPLILLFAALLIGFYELLRLRTRFAWGKCNTVFANAGLLLFMAFCLWEAYHAFIVEMNVRMITGKLIGANTEQYDLEVELSNRGKPTSLRNWRAFLTLPDGSKITGLPQSLHGTSAEMQDAHGQKISYRLPDCDLTIETSRAVQTGDSVYGIIGFAFPGAVSFMDDKRNVIELQATDMLGRTVRSPSISFKSVSEHERTVFPCFTAESLPVDSYNTHGGR